MLDSTNYLSSFGWQGKGTGLREGGVSRPLAIPQKRTLAGVGKDRDEAFPFWDHLFTAAAKSIQIKVLGDDDIEENGTITPTQASLLRTTTGILSNRRPVTGTPATSGTATPSDATSQYPIPRLSLMATAKRESARKRLYARFFRGPVLGPDVEADADSPTVVVGGVTVPDSSSGTEHTRTAPERKKKEKKHRPDDSPTAVEEGKERKKKKHKGGDTKAIADGEPTLKRKQEGLMDKGMEEAKQEDGRKLKTLRVPAECLETAEQRRHKKAAKAERRKRKDERRKAKAEK